MPRKELNFVQNNLFVCQYHHLATKLNLVPIVCCNITMYAFPLQTIAKQSQPTYHYRLASNKTNVFRDDFLLTLLSNEGEPNDIGVKGIIFACGAVSFPPPVYDLIKTREKTIEVSAHETTLPGDE